MLAEFLLGCENYLGGYGYQLGIQDGGWMVERELDPSDHLNILDVFLVK